MRTDHSKAPQVRQRRDAGCDADLGIGHGVIDRRDQVVDQPLEPLDERRGQSMRAGADVHRRGLERQARLLLAHLRIDGEDRESRAIERHFDLFARPRVAEQEAQRLREEIHTEDVIAVGDERVIDGNTAARTDGRTVHVIHLRRGLRQLERGLARRPFRIANREHRDAARGAEVAFHQGRRKCLDVSDVIETIADRVGRQERRDVHGKIEQAVNLARVLGAVQALKRTPAWIRLGDGKRIHPRFECRHELRELRGRRTPGAARRHHAGAELVNHLLGEFAFRRCARHIPAGQRQLAGLAAVVMTAGAVLLDQFCLSGSTHAQRGCMCRSRLNRRLG